MPPRMWRPTTRAALAKCVAAKVLTAASTSADGRRRKRNSGPKTLRSASNGRGGSEAAGGAVAAGGVAASVSTGRKSRWRCPCSRALEASSGT
eukprot:scaffold51988_cov59-Phaeocystis_antarctica.AAC.4